MDLTGQRFGRLLVQSLGEPYISPKSRYEHKRYTCICSCGVVKLIRESSLKYGYTGSCGCLAKDIQRKAMTTHGLTKHPLFTVWFDMNRRCYDVSRKDYKHYGGRGISVCDRWRRVNPEDSAPIENFIEDMFSTYDENLEIERVDVNLGYSRENCTWVTRRIQVINRRPSGSKFNTHFIEFDGKRLCISQWADEVGLNSQVLVDRLSKLGWSVEKTLTTPLMERGKKIDP